MNHSTGHSSDLRFGHPVDSEKIVSALRGKREHGHWSNSVWVLRKTPAVSVISRKVESGDFKENEIEQIAVSFGHPVFLMGGNTGWGRQPVSSFGMLWNELRTGGK